jgi:bla regulator protein BlaR1
MDSLLHAGLSNAAAAAVLAVIAAIAGFFCRRPAVRHALWLLVLLKLVTPPLVDVRLPWLGNAPAPAEVSVALAPELDAAPDADDEFALGIEDDLLEPLEEPAAAPVTAPTEEPFEQPAMEWRPLIIALWVSGSTIWLVAAASRAWRFSRLVKQARPAGASLQREADELAVRLGLARAPAIRLLPGRISPMLWAPGTSPRLLLPGRLLGRLGAEGRRTLVAHELAHLRRGDHRVRLLELAVAALFWWHPVVWWARRELREAEEQCCDAWVLWALPKSAKTYALALVETVDFLSEVRPTLPALASGMGHVNDLRRRVTMIMQGTTPRALTWSGLLALLGLGGFLLPVMPTWAQQPGEPLRITVTGDGAGQPIRVLNVETEVQDLKKGQPESAEMHRLKAELEQRRAELARAEAALRAAEARLKAGAAAGKTNQENIVIEIVDGDSRQLLKVPAASRMHSSLSDTIRLPDGSRILSDIVDAKVKEKLDKVKEMADKEKLLRAGQLQLRLAEEGKNKADTKGEAKKEQRRVIIEIISDGKRQVIELPAGSRIITESDMKKAAPAKGAGAADVRPLRVPVTVRGRLADTDTEKRLMDLEKRLDELMRAVKELHGELKTKPKPGGGPKPDEGSNSLRFRLPLKDGPATP